MKIFWSKKSSKKGSALMSVMCMMTFVIMMATIALTAVSSAHTNMVHEYKIQQAYYTAKSAAETTADYISSIGGPNSSNPNTSSLAYKLSTIAGQDGVKIEGEWTRGTTLGDYKVDIYGTPDPKVFKIVSTSEYNNATRTTALLVGPTTYDSGVNDFEDAVVGKREISKIGGNCRILGGLSTEEPFTGDNHNSAQRFSGNISSLTNVTLSMQKANTTEYFENHYGKGYYLIAGTIDDYGNMSGYLGLENTVAYTTTASDELDKNHSPWEYYSYFISGGVFRISHADPKDSGGILYKFASASGIPANEKAILVGGDFKFDTQSYAEFDAPVYVRGVLDLPDAANVVFKEPVYIYCDSTNRVKIKGNVTFEKGLYIYDETKVDQAYNNISGWSPAYGSNDRFTYYDNMLRDKLTIPSSKVDQYDYWVFSADERKQMGLDPAATSDVTGVVTKDEDKVNKYDFKVVKVNNVDTCQVDVTKNGTTTTMDGVAGKIVNYNNNTLTDKDCYRFTINESGYINSFNFQTGEYKEIIFDTNAPGGGYRDLYIRVATNDFSLQTHSNACRFFVKGRGNVYFFLSGTNIFKRGETVIQSMDFPGEPHFFFISNSSQDTLTIHFDAGSKTAESDTFDMFLYAPYTNITINGQLAFNGIIVGNDVEITGTSLERPFTYKSPVDSNGVPWSGGLANKTPTTTRYGVVMRLRS